MGMYKFTKKEAKQAFEKGITVYLCTKRNFNFANCKSIKKEYGNFEEQVEKFAEKNDILRPTFWV